MSGSDRLSFPLARLDDKEPPTMRHQPAASDAASSASTPRVPRHGIGSSIDFDARPFGMILDMPQPQE
jgi:hypothetical protein